MKLKNTVALFLSLLLMTNAFITANAAVGESVGADPTYTELYCSKTAKEAVDGDVLEQFCDLLINRVEPRAVNMLLDKLPALKAAAEQDGLSSEIGMYVYHGRGDYDTFAHFIDGTAAASASICPIEDEEENISLGQLIAFNTNKVIQKDADEKSYFETNSHEWLRYEYAVLHELMHSMMYDYNRAGMMGYNDPESINIGYGDVRQIRNKYIKLLSFPAWFVEGTASAIGDGYDQVDDIYETFKNTDGVFTAESVLNAYLDNIYNTIKSGSVMAGYVSGYLAMFYLCDLAAKQNPEVGAAITENNGEFRMDNQKLLYGFNDILSRLHNGETLDGLINNLSGGRFANTADFEERFICGEQVDDTYTGDEETLGLCVNILNYFDGLTKTHGETANGSFLVPFENVGAFPFEIDTDAQADFYKTNGSNDYVESVMPEAPYSDGGRSVCGKNVPIYAQMEAFAEEMSAAEWETMNDFDWFNASLDDVAEKLSGLSYPYSNTLRALQSMEGREDFRMALYEVGDISYDFRAILSSSEYPLDWYWYDPMFGDVDGNGVITVGDATVIQRAVAEMKQLSAFQTELADVDGDGSVTVQDVTCVQDYLAEFASGFGSTGKSYYEGW